MKILVATLLMLSASKALTCEGSKEYLKCEKKCSRQKSIADYFDCAQECKDTYCIEGYDNNALSVERDVDHPRSKNKNLGS